MSQQTLTTSVNVGTVSPDCPDGCPVESSQNVEVTATPAHWWMSALEWDASGITLSEHQRHTSPLQFTMPENPVALTANFGMTFRRWLRRSRT